MIETDQVQLSESTDEILPIEELQNHGITMPDILKLKQYGICTIKGLSMVTKRHLSKIKGLSELKIDRLKEVAGKAVRMDFTTATEYAAKREQVVRIATGSSDLDTLLNGGVQTMSVTEIFGEFRTGKTQICLTLCITAQLHENSKVAYIDTEGTFRPERLREIAARFDIDQERALQNVICARAYNSDHQVDLLNTLSARFSEDTTYRLLVIDSVIALFRTDFIGRGELGERQQKLNIFLSRLQRMAEEYNIAVLITNQMMSDPSATLTFVADPKKPIGGHVLAHASTTRIYLRKGKGETRIAKIYDSPELPENEAMYAITSGGIDNACD